MKNTLHLWAALFAFLGMLGATPGHAQTATFSEDFTGASTINNWYYFGGACLTAGTTATGVEPGSGARVHISSIELLLAGRQP